MTRNLTLLTDFYQLTMMNGYFREGIGDKEAVFDMFFRPKGQINYAVAAGLEQVVDYILNIKFTDDDIAYLKSLGTFTDEFLNYLRTFKFTGDLYAVREGEIVFPMEPIVIVKAPLIQAQFVETALLCMINHQTLIATKADRMTSAAGEGTIVEFGLRRAQGPDAGIYGARASMIGGAIGTSNVLAGQMFGIPVKGTHAHSWVMSFPDELSAFNAFADLYPDSCLLLVDTYDTLGSGIPNAIKVFNRLKAEGHKPLGIRLDSGDLAYLSKQARKMLDDAGFPDTLIFAGNDIDENVISALNAQEAKIDMYGIGTKLITSESMPSLGGVYKLSAIEQDGKLVPKLKKSDSIEKITNPGFKTLYRVYNKNSGKAFADVIALKDEKLPKPLVLTHETERWKQCTLGDYEIRELMVKIIEGGKCVYKFPTIPENAAYRRAELADFWEEYKRLESPHIHKVDLSEGLYELKQKLLMVE